MKIIPLKEGIFSRKDDNTEVVYQIFPEFEIHYNKLPPKSRQLWHHHQKIKEIICITSGSMTAFWKENNKEISKIVNVSDTINVENSPHTFENKFDQECRFIVFRFVPQGKDQREIIKNDKYLD